MPVHCCPNNNQHASQPSEAQSCCPSIVCKDLHALHGSTVCLLTELSVPQLAVCQGVSPCRHTVCSTTVQHQKEEWRWQQQQQQKQLQQQQQQHGQCRGLAWLAPESSTCCYHLRYSRHTRIAAHMCVCVCWCLLSSTDIKQSS